MSEDRDSRSPRIGDEQSAPRRRPPTTSADDDGGHGDGVRRSRRGERAVAVVHPGTVRRLLRRATTRASSTDHCLDVTILEGGVEIVPQTQLANGDADFAISWVSKALASREAGADITNIAQIFQRSGHAAGVVRRLGHHVAGRLRRQEDRQLGLRQRVRDVRGARRGRSRPGHRRRVGRPAASTWSPCSKASIDAAEAMTYNEYAQVLETVNPDTGELYQPDGLQRHQLHRRRRRHAAGRDLGRRRQARRRRRRTATSAVSFVAASMEGWIYCRDNVEACQQIVLAAGPTLGASHQLWQMNEVNKLIWPASERDRLHRPGRLGPDGRAQPEHAEPGGHDRVHRPSRPTGRSPTRSSRRPARSCHGDAAARSFGADYAPIEVTLNEGGN